MVKSNFVITDFSGEVTEEELFSGLPVELQNYVAVMA